MTLPVGALLDRYAVEALIGDGAMGKVYRAFDTRLRRTVALKVFNTTPDADGAAAVTTVLREARAAAAIRHPNVATIFDVDQIGGASFIVMEHVSGVSLRRIVGDGTVPMATRLRWLLEIARALAAAHQVRVIHRDVRPENVIVSHEGPVKVLDFGTARRPRGEVPSPAGVDQLTPSSGNEVIGGPAYLAPERIRGEKIDCRSDQFAWGVVAYELLAGASPWTPVASPYAVLAAVLKEDPAPFPADLGVPDEVAAAVRRALAKSPDERFSSMIEVADAVEPHAALSQGTAAGVVSRRPQSFPTLPDATPASQRTLPGLAASPVITSPRLPTARAAAPERARAGASFEILDGAASRLHLAYGNVQVNIWQANISVSDIHAASAVGREMSRRYPAGIGSINIAHRSATIPSAAAREAGSASLTEAQRWLLATAIVIDGKGFAAGAARAAYAVIQLAAKLQCPQGVFPDVEAATRWLATKCPIDGTAEELARCIAEARLLVA